MSKVMLSNVGKSFGRTRVLRDVNVEIEDGEFVVLVGPSGCGKSTLLRMIAGLENVTNGEIRIGERRVNNVPAKKRDIAMVFQSYALYPHMTVSENMSFSLRLAHAPAADRKSRVEKAAEILGLGALIDRYPRQLSGGQRQRVAMGRAIVRDPKVFLFDEPLSNLDAKLRVAMRAEIRALHQRLKNTVIYVTHDQIEAMTMADRIVVMNAGEVAQVGPPLDLYDRPANRFVAGFLGSPAMNFLEGRIVDGWFEVGPDLRLELPTGSPVRQGPSVYGIRPEHFELRQGDGEACGLELEVDVVEPTGTETVVLGHVGPHEIVATFRDRLPVEPGTTLPLRPDPTRAHLFDLKSGVRIDKLS